jgi:hypothetical protein
VLLAELVLSLQPLALWLVRSVQKALWSPLCAVFAESVAKWAVSFSQKLVKKAQPLTLAVLLRKSTTPRSTPWLALLAQRCWAASWVLA